MLPFLIIIAQILLIFLLGNMVKRRLFWFAHKITRNKNATISFVSLLLYPGVVIHELSHLITAVVLFVPVKGITLVPKVVDGRLRGGAVFIAKVDPIRRTLVGIAPLFVGIAALWLITAYVLPPLPIVCDAFSPSHPKEGTTEGSIQINSGSTAGMTSEEIVSLQSARNDSISPKGYELEALRAQKENIVCDKPDSFIPDTTYLILQIVIALYLIFSISLTMYSSRSDLTALLYTIPLLLVIGIASYILGVQGSWIAEGLNNLTEIFWQIVLVLSIPIAIQLTTLGVLYILVKR